MILLCGIASETPLAMVRDRLEQMNVPFVLFNQRQFASMAMQFEISGNEVVGRLQVSGQQFRLEDFTGVYTRLMDEQNLPELQKELPHSPLRRHCRALHDTLNRWTEIAPLRVVNRAEPMGSNFSKPYQAQLICEQGFEVPETLITNSPERVQEFLTQHGKVIYKSISGIRSIVQTLQECDLERLDQIRWCPIQFQEFVEGTNVRVHVVDTEVFATAIATNSTDYRYAHKQGGETELAAIDLPNILSERCVQLARALGLAFAGVDLKITPDGRVFCFEVNPSPAFSYYEASTGQPIAQAVAHYLVNGSPI
jgi:predicted ATP-grasp superfamily ATP-dependent carboligase